MHTSERHGRLQALTERMAPAVDAPLRSFGERLSRVAAQMALSPQEINDFGTYWFGLGEYARARVCYALASAHPEALGARMNLARCDIRLGHAASAIAYARSLLDDDPRNAGASLLLAEAREALGQWPAAIETVARALSVADARMRPRLLYRLGELRARADDPEGAHAAFEEAYASRPDDMRALERLLHHKRHLCDWSDLGQLEARLHRSVGEGRAIPPPLMLVVQGADARVQLAGARRAAERMADAVATAPAPAIARPRSRRLRLGLISGGFGRHATTVLVASLVEHLRNTDMDVHLFSTRQEVSPERDRLKASAHAFHDVAPLPPRARAMAVRGQGIDVLVDLNGYGEGYLPQELAYRAAPLQVNWLAYPGTSGAPWMDYVIADRFVLPPHMQSGFTERIAYLPRCYQPCDATRPMPQAPSRERCGLPSDGVVYACFNASYKLGPRSFARMLRVLAQVPESVLWLLKPPGLGAERLRKEAMAAWIDPARLVFMDKLPHLHYLARYRHADLFLDTEHCNAHTTASDALWAGCPVLTRPGETFAARVAGSLNHHLGMHELNASSDERFVELAVRAGLDARVRTGWRHVLAEAGRHSPVFDMAGFAKDLEALLQRLVATHVARRQGGASTPPRERPP